MTEEQASWLLETLDGIAASLVTISRELTEANYRESLRQR